MTGWIRGNQLSPKEQNIMKKAFVNRYTREHTPTWAIDRKTKDGKLFPVHFDSDAQWLSHSEFMFYNWNSRRRTIILHCRSSIVWPDGVPSEISQNARALHESSVRIPASFLGD